MAPPALTPAPHWLADALLPVSATSIGPLLRAAASAGALELPLPGGGRTLERWQALAELAAVDLVLGRLAEAHADALAIRAELGAVETSGDQPSESLLWGVWAAEPPLGPGHRDPER